MLNSKQKKCVALLVAGDKTQKEIAEKLKVSEATICNWKKNKEFATEYTTAMKDSIKDVAARAFNTEKKLLAAHSEMVRFLTAKDILDRAGFKPEDKLNIDLEPVIIMNDLKE